MTIQRTNTPASAPSPEAGVPHTHLEVSRKRAILDAH